VGDVMDMNAMVVLSPDSNMKDAVVLLAKQRGLAIVAEHDKVLGVVTGGDLARFLERDSADLQTPVHRVMASTPRTAREGELGSAVVHRMEQAGIMAMPVLDENAKLVGVVHLHDLLRAGVA
ncbi:MAG: CBS domain-containing protein, partial [Gemmatimonas sp.]